MRAAWGATLAVLLSSVPALSQPRQWEIDARASYVVLGSKERLSGGLMPSIAGRRSWQVHEAWDIAVGAGIGVFGIGGGPRWIGVLGGPTVSARLHPFIAPLSFGLTAHADFGRIPVCNAWGLCLRYVGLYPALEAGVGYSFMHHVEVVGLVSVRVVRTIGWSGASVEPSAGARFFW